MISYSPKVNHTDHIIRKNGRAFLLVEFGLGWSWNDKIDLKLGEVWKPINNPNFLEKNRFVVLKINGRLQAFDHDKKNGNYWQVFQMMGGRLMFAHMKDFELVSYF